MKNVLIIIALCGSAIFSCSPPKSEPENYNTKLPRLIFSNNQLKGNFERVLDLNDSTYHAFKVLVSRRDRFLRISIYGLINKDEISEYPSSYFTYRSKTFLCYDGSEILDNKRLDSIFMNKLKAKMATGMTNDSRVFQFDIDSTEKITIHIPAINPYDFNFDGFESNRVLFPVTKKH